MEKRKRRSFSKEYKAEVVALIRKGGKSIGAVASDLALSETAVRRWVSQAEIDSGGGPSGALTTAEREELAQLRKRVKTLEMERKIPKKQRRPSSRKRANEIPLHRGGEGPLPHSFALSLPRGFEIWLLRLAKAPCERARQAGCAPEG